jgi:hypothetical protein
VVAKAEFPKVLPNDVSLNYISQAEACAFDPRRLIQIFYEAVAAASPGQRQVQGDKL